MVLHSGDIVIHTRIEEREHNLFFYKSKAIESSAIWLFSNVVIRNSLRHLILNDLVDHIFEILLD